jgi:hypothetical protein
MPCDLRIFNRFVMTFVTWFLMGKAWGEGVWRREISKSQAQIRLPPYPERLILGTWGIALRKKMKDKMPCKAYMVLIFFK